MADPPPLVRPARPATEPRTDERAAGKRPREPEDVALRGGEPPEPPLPPLPHPESPSRLPVRLSILAWRDVEPGAARLGLGAMLTLPFDVMAAPRIEVAPLVPAVATSLPDPPSSAPVLDEIRLPPARVRALVRAAWRAARLLPDDDRVANLAARARASALLPELRLRVLRTVDESLRLAPTEDDPTRATSSGGVAMHYEARATWRLDRLAFADEEVPLERIRAEQGEQRLRLTMHVLEAVAAWQRATARSVDPTISAYDRADASVRAAVAETTLDALTDGAWSERPRERQPAPSR